MARLSFLMLMFAFLSISLSGQNKVSFHSGDGLEITADTYFSNSKAEVIVLCHQARYSRGEYMESAKTLVSMGYQCIAIDQRSGEQVNGVMNETHKRAKDAGKGTDYLDAEQDIVAAVEYAFKHSGQQVILVGSSYSAALVLKIAAEMEEVKAVISFSPGEYFGDKLKLGERISGMEKPVFLTSSRKEAPAVKQLAAGIDNKYKTQFIPTLEGYHGSKALWLDHEGHEAYWAAITTFLKGL